MKPLHLGEIAAMTAGRLDGADAVVAHVATDSRALAALDPATRARTLFVALKGERFDGHDHVAAAFEAGVAGALVTRVQGNGSQVQVADTQLALADMARGVQASRATRVIAITGSNGKTSVKTLATAIFGEAGLTYATPGNRNNEIGLPLAVLEAPEEARFAVYEMGAGAPGDIAYLTGIARPHVSVVNNIGPAHLERLGSLEGIAETKGAIYEALPDDGVAAINVDDAFAPYFTQLAGERRQVRFGLDAPADVTARAVTLEATGSRFTLVTPAGEARVALHLPGLHNVRNALAATSLALGAGVALPVIVRGLEAAQGVEGRLATYPLPGGAVLVDDSYNANPASLAAGIQTLAAQGGRAWLALGDMRELGDDAQRLHAEAGRQARAAGLERLYAIGPLSAAAAAAFGPGGRVFDTHEALADALRADLAPDVRVLVKGSRGSAMDRVVRLLREAAHAA